MKYLFLTVLMIGVGIGIVGCEDDDKDPPPEEEVLEEETTESQPPKWEPDISGLWQLYDVRTGTNGSTGFSVFDLRIRQSAENIVVEHISFSDPESEPISVGNGYVTKNYTVTWGNYSGIISWDTEGMWGTNVFTWGTSVWNAAKQP